MRRSRTCTGNLSALLLAAGLVSTALPVAARTGVDILPKRVVFEMRTRSASVDVINRGDETTTFRVDVRDPDATPDAGTVVNPAAPLQAATSMFVFTPKQFTLEPGKAQVVRIALRKPADLGDGEYRSNLYVSTIPKKADTSIEKVVAGDKPTVSFRAASLPGVRVPLIVRQGALTGAVALSEATLRPVGAEGCQVKVKAARTGNASVYGHMQLVPAAEQKAGKRVVLAESKGWAVYSDQLERVFDVGFNVTPPTQPVALELVDDKGKVLARTDVKVASAAAAAEQPAGAGTK